jgi:uncharacterized repeat protein (TIGR01451 family)
MKYYTPNFTRRNVRAFFASLLSYLLIAGQMTPLVMASNSSATRVAPSQAADIARGRAGQAAPVSAAPVPVRLSPVAAVLVPNITATKTDSYPSSPNPAQPGETITYTVQITNNGTDATNVTLTDTVDPNTTIVPGSAVSTPIAVNDAYNVVGNVRIQPNTAQGLLANDNNPQLGGNAGLTVTTLAGDNTAPFSGTSAQGGEVTSSAADGSFSYDPPVGFTGTDTFTYTVTSANGTNTATVTLTVSGMVFFVNDDDPTAGGDGRLSNPFNCLVGTGCFSQSTADEPGDNIFLFSGAYTGGLTLLANQKLIGQGASATLASFVGVTPEAYSDSLPPTGGASPTITTTLPATNAITVSAGGITLRGFTVGATTGAKILGTSFGTLTAGNNTTPDLILGGAGQALSLTNGTFAATSALGGVATTSSAGQGIFLSQIAGTVAFGSTSVSGSTTQGILFQQSTANVNFGNTTVAGGTDGISLSNNSAGTRTFGTLTRTGGTGVGFLHAVGGGITNITGATSISGTGGRGIDIEDSTTAVTFANVTVGTTTGTGVFLEDNSGAISFADLDVTVTGPQALFVNNSSGTVTATSGDIASTNNNALTITGPAGRTPLALSLTSISSTNNANASGTGINVNLASGTLTVTGATNVQNPAGIGIQIQNSTANFSFQGNTTSNASGGTGIFLNANSGNISFPTSGTFSVTPDSGQRGFHATSNVTGTLSAGIGVVTTTNNTAVEIVGTSAANRTPLNFRLTTVNTTGGAAAPNGIRLVNTSATGSPGGFRILGNGGVCTAATPTCTGGRITNTTGGDNSSAAPGGTGISLDNAATVVITLMRIDNHTNYGIRGTSVSAFSLSNSLVDGTNGTNQNNPFNEGSINFAELSGTSSISTSEITGGFLRNVAVDNTLGTLDLTVTGNNIHHTGNTAGDDGLFIEIGSSGGASNATLHVTNNTFSAHGGGHFDLTMLDSPTVSLVFTGNTASNGTPAHAIGLGENYRVLAASFNGAFTYDVSNNTISGTNQGHAIQINKGSGTGTFSGRVSGNTIGISGQVLSGAAQSNGISVESRGGGSHTTLVTNNTIRQYRDIGINIEGAEAGTTTMNATVTGNTVDEPGSPGVAGLSLHGIQLNWGVDVGNTSTACVDIGGGTAALRNIVTNAGNEAAGGADIRPRQRQSTTVRLPGYGGANNDNTAVNNYLLARNTATSVVASNSVPPGGGFVGGAACTQPTIPTAPIFFDASSGGDGPSDGGGSTLGAPEQQTATQDTNVTSRPFVSMPRQTTAARTTTTTTQQSLGVSTPTTPTATQQSADSATVHPPVINGDTLTFTIGNLPAGESVTITFQVTIDNPFPSLNPSQVSNQGTVTADEGVSVLTDDPDVAGANNPTVTPVVAPPDITIKNASGPEPLSGSSPMAFTVILSTPAPAGGVSVNFTTAEDTGGTDPATEGVDYTPTSGTLNFAAGQSVQTISVPVLHDNDAPEPDETFLVDLSGAVGGIITDSQAVGTITAANPAGDILISELRTFGPGGAGDDFVEVYNNSPTNSPVTVAASDASAGWALVRMGASCTDTPVVIGVIPNGTVIPARGHYLFVGSQYSLGSYAAGNLTMTSDIGENANVALFNTANVLNISTATRLDAVGFAANLLGNNCDLLREGNALPSVSSGASGLAQHSYYRSLYSFVPGVGPTVPNPGFPADRNDNGADFLFVDTNATNAAGVSQQRLGAPGPENLTSPRVNDNVGGFLLDASMTSAQAPNRARNVSDTGPNKTFGTMSLRRRFTNNTGAAITRLRFRVVEATTFPRPDGATADVRALSSTSVSVSGVNDAGTCAANGVPATAPCTVTVQGTTLEEPPTQANGGGYNSSLSAGTITLGTPLANGASISVQFVLGIEQTGNFRFLLNVEALP